MRRSWASTGYSSRAATGPWLTSRTTPTSAASLRLVHAGGKPRRRAVSTGPAALLSAPQADGAWMFDGYRMTAFTDEEEDQTKAGKIGMPWYVEAALKNRGAIFDDGDAAWVSHVCRRPET